MTTILLSGQKTQMNNQWNEEYDYWQTALSLSLSLSLIVNSWHLQWRYPSTSSWIRSLFQQQSAHVQSANGIKTSTTKTSHGGACWSKGLRNTPQIVCSKYQNGYHFHCVLFLKTKYPFLLFMLPGGPLGTWVGKHVRPEVLFRNGLSYSEHSFRVSKSANKISF